MFTPFLYANKVSYGGPAFSRMRYIRERLQANYTRMEAYYRTSGGWVESRHFLIRLLGNLGVGLWNPPDVYYRLVLDRYDDAGRALGVTAPTVQGVIHRNGSFFGQGSHEIYLAIETTISPDKVNATWEKQIPIKVIRHPYGDFNMTIPDGRGYNGEGISVFTIDIPILALMYRAWNERESRKDPGERETPSQFIYQYVLPKIMQSYCDVSLFNHLNTRILNAGLESSGKRVVVALPTPDSYVSAIVDEYHDWATVSPRSFYQLLQHIPTVFAVNYEGIVIPHLPVTRHNKWALVTAQLPLTSFLVGIIKQTESHASADILIDIARDIRILRVGRWFQGVPGSTVSRINDELGDLGDLVGERA